MMPPPFRVLLSLGFILMVTVACQLSGNDNQTNSNASGKATTSQTQPAATPIAAEIGTGDSFVTRETKSADVQADVGVPEWTSGTTPTTVQKDVPDEVTAEPQAVRDQSAGLDGCLFTPYGIGGDVPVYKEPEFSSAVVQYIVMDESYAVVDNGGSWRILETGNGGQFYQIRLDEETLGWVQDMRGNIVGDCSSFQQSTSIDFLEVSPSILYAGETLTLFWQANGVSAEICPVARYTYFTVEDCQPVPLNGSLNFTVPADLEPSFAPGFRLRVDGVEGTESQEVYVYVNLYCDESWFFDPEQPVGPVCPQPQIISTAAIQHFERGTMIWLEELGRYYIFSPLPFSQTPLRRHESFAQVDDPVTIIDDTSGTYVAPAGFFAPVSGFGYLWRGDVSEIGPLHQSLGWATAPEYSYEATFQCSEFISTQVGFTCYLNGSEGELIWIDSNQRRWLRSR
jgi:hypothetical protein